MPLNLKIMSQKPALPKGTRDFLPSVMIRREYIFSVIKEVFKKYGYQPIETPAVELLSVLTGKYGEEGDKLIFKILNSGNYLSKRGKALVTAEDLEKGERYMTPVIAEKALRYDLTVPFARFVVMHQNDLNFPFKRYQIQPVWRADRPQKGRYREFYQCDADVVGSDSLISEAEFLAIYDEVLSRLGLTEFTVMLSNRKVLNGFSEVIGAEDKFTSICIAIDKLDKIGEEGVAKELQERGLENSQTEQLFGMITFEGTNEEKLTFLQEKFADSEIGKKGLAEMREVLDLHTYMPKYNAAIDFSLTLARGLDYYTGTIFEVGVDNVKIGSIASGGRYDDLTGVFGKSGLSGVGISFGADRIYDVMQELNLFDEVQRSVTNLLIVNFGSKTLPYALQTLSKLREQGISAEIYPEDVKMKKQFTYADKKEIPFTVILGDEEMEENKYTIKDMASGEQETMDWEELLHRFRK